MNTLKTNQTANRSSTRHQAANRSSIHHRGGSPRGSLATTVRHSAGLLLGLILLTGGAAAQPNMVVRVDGEEIANHTELTFEPTRVGEASAMLVVVLRNQSAEDLIFTDSPPVFMAGGFPESFTLIQPALEEPGDLLSPNGSTAFGVRLTPQIAFNSLFTHLYIYTNESAAPFHIVVRGEGLPELSEVSQPGDESDESNGSDESGGSDSAGDSQDENAAGGANEDGDADDVTGDGSTEGTETNDQTTDGTEELDEQSDEDDFNDEGDGEFDDFDGTEDGEQFEDDVLDDREDEQRGEQDDDATGNGGMTEQEADETLEEIDGLLPAPGMCGFGMGFAGFMSLMGLAPLKLGARRKRK